MRSINPTFTDEEFEQIDTIKSGLSMNWHDIVLKAIIEYGVDNS